MASQDTATASKLPLILAGASVAVSTTIAALAVWWASQSGTGNEKSSKKKASAAQEKAANDAPAYQYVR
jgi:hypothetical protein